MEALHSVFSYEKSYAVLSNHIICDIQRMKRLKLSTEKCRLLKIDSEANNDDTVSISGEKVEIKNSFKVDMKCKFLFSRMELHEKHE